MKLYFEDGTVIKIKIILATLKGGERWNRNLRMEINILNEVNGGTLIWGWKLTFLKEVKGETVIRGWKLTISKEVNGETMICWWK